MHWAMGAALMESILITMDELAQSGMLEVALTAAGLPALAAGFAAYRKIKNAKKSSSDTNRSWFF